MMGMLEIKEQLRRFYQQTSRYLQPLGKFVFSLLIFKLLNRELGFNETINRLEIELLLALVCAFTPSQLFVFLAAAVTTIHVYAVSKALAVLVAAIFLVMFCFFAKFTPYAGYTVVLMPLLSFIRIPYCVPILLGMFSTPVAAIPVSLGVLLHSLIEVIKGTGSANVSTSIEDVLALYKTVMETWLGNRDMYFAIGIFFLVLLITYVVRRQEFNYSFETAILIGGAVNVLGFLAGNLFLGTAFEILPIVIGTIISVLIAYIVWFFRLTLDHTAIERLQFEDDDYYYYVKAVPKMKVTAREKNIKRINEKKEMENDEL